MVGEGIWDKVRLLISMSVKVWCRVTSVLCYPNLSLSGATTKCFYPTHFYLGRLSHPTHPTHLTQCVFHYPYMQPLNFHTS